MADKQYIVRVPNKGYNGVTCGVRFYSGEALIAPHTISPYLDRTVEEVVDLMRKDFADYEITEIVPDGVLPGVAEPATESKPKAKRTRTRDVTK